MKMHDLGVLPTKTYNTESPNPIGPADTSKPTPMYPTLSVSHPKDLGVTPGQTTTHAVKMKLIKHTIDAKKGIHSYEFDMHGISPPIKGGGIKGAAVPSPTAALAKGARKMSNPSSEEDNEPYADNEDSEMGG